MARKCFTVDEANALIPLLEHALRQVGERRDTIRERTDKLQVLDAIWGAGVAARTNPDHGEYLEHRAEIARALGDVQRIVNDEIMERGLRFPAGGLEHGLIDFPTTFDGRWIYLCWRSPEPRIVAWHEVDGGFAGRRVLTTSDAARMGLADDPARQDDSILDF